MTPREILIEARNLISDKSRWTINALARTANRNPIGPREVNAVCWCAFGAIEHCSSPADGLAVFEIISPLCWEQFGVGVAELNDCRGHKDVLKLFDMAIKQTEE